MSKTLEKQMKFNISPFNPEGWGWKGTVVVALGVEKFDDIHDNGGESWQRNDNFYNMQHAVENAFKKCDGLKLNYTYRNEWSDGVLNLFMSIEPKECATRASIRNAILKNMKAGGFGFDRKIRYAEPF